MKKIIFSLVMAFMAITVNAQIATENAKLIDNTYIGVGGQVSTPLDFYNVFPLNPAVSLTLGKELTPVFGFNVEGTAWLGSHASKGSQMRFDRPDAHNAVRGTYLGLNGTMNLTNLFCGYTGTPRKFELQTVTGLGWFHTYRAHLSDRMRDDLGAKTGLNFNFNLGANKAHTIYVQPAVLWNLTTPASHHDHIAFNKMGSQMAISVGYVYHFKTSNGTHAFKLWDVGAMNNEINLLRAELEKKPNEVITKVIERVPVTTTVENLYVVLFAQGSAELSTDAKSVLNNIPTDVTVNLVGTASVEGSDSFNKQLSVDRANNVAAYLRNRGVNVKDVTGVGSSGGVTSNRLVMVTVVK